MAGTALVIDGDTIEIAGTSIRLEGIDAPEAGQSCKRRLMGAGCGTAATAALTRMLEGKAVRCDHRGTDKYGACLACASSMAKTSCPDGARRPCLGFVKYSEAYVAEEAKARTERRGVWQAETETPWDFRAKKWVGAEQKSPDARHQRQRDQERAHLPHAVEPLVRPDHIDAEKGKRWFCSEAEAIAAGWRPSKFTKPSLSRCDRGLLLPSRRRQRTTARMAAAYGVIIQLPHVVFMLALDILLQIIGASICFAGIVLVRAGCWTADRERHGQPSPWPLRVGASASAQATRSSLRH